MRKAILSLVLVCALASLAMAVPDGPGGTIYFSDLDYTGYEQRLYRLNVDSNWDPVYDNGTAVTPDANDAVLHYATVPDDMLYQDTNLQGMRSIWYHPVSGKLDMNGTYNNASVLVGAYYNPTPCGTADATGTVLRGADILSVRAGASVAVPDVSVLHEGMDSRSGDTVNAHTAEHRWQVTVDNGFTQTGAATGFATGEKYTSALWEDGGDGVSGYCATGTRPPNYGTPRQFAYAPCNTTIDPDGAGGNDGVAVTGLLAVNTGQTGDTEYTYDTAAGLVHVTGASTGTGVPADYYWYPYNSRSMAMGDTDNDGMLDAYWSGHIPGGGYAAVHAQDANADGDWMDEGETWDAGAMSIVKSYGLELVECPSGLWALLVWTSNSSAIKVYGLDAYGDYDPDNTVDCFVKTILATADDSSIELLHRGSNVSECGGKDRMAFAPLTSAVPEPTTMLLVGTGILGLAGVIRRRLIG